MKVDFQQGAYTARNVTADAQRQVNLYAEPGSVDSPHKVSLYPTPGLQLIADYTGSISGRCRCLYWASSLQLFAVFGTSFGRINQDYSWHSIGNIGADTGYPVSMVDNSLSIFIVDGSTQGWTYGLVSGTFAACTDPNFHGASRVDYIDTYFIFNKINTQQFYISNSLAITFNPLWFANKVGYSDLLVSIAALHDAVWLFGEVTTEIWFDSGGDATNVIPFQRMPQSILQFGCISTYSVVVAGNGVYWMSQDRHGRLMFLRGEGYSAKRVSNFAVEQAWSQYDLSSGAIISMAYQAGGHEFIVIQFTGPGQTWVLDATTEFWHQRQTGSGAWLPLAISYWKQGPYTFAGSAQTNLVVAGDSSVAKLYAIEQNYYTDNGVPITRTRSWPHVLDDQKRVSHHQFVAAMSGTSLTPDQISLSWSDDGGQTFGTPVTQTTNNASNGQYSWQRLGMARDRVYQLSWTATGETALNGAWIEAEASDT